MTIKIPVDCNHEKICAELKPCPFCGNAVTYTEESCPEGMYGLIRCLDNSCILWDTYDFQENIGGDGSGKSKLFLQWNRRQKNTKKEM